MSSMLFNPHTQVTDKNGKPVDGAKVWVYEAGTTTPASIFTDVGLGTPSANPVVCDSNGIIPAFYLQPDTLYKTVQMTAADVEISTADNITPMISSASGTLPIGSGGTGATTASGARAALGAASQTELDQLSSDLGDATNAQSQTDWNEGASTLETVVSPEKLVNSINHNQATQSGVPDAIIFDSRLSGVSGGNAVANAWTNRSLNAKQDPQGLIGLGGNRFTPSKSGFVRWNSSFFSTSGTKTRLYNDTDSAEVTPTGLSYLTGSSAVNASGAAYVEAGKDYFLQYYCTAAAANGLGTPVASGSDEIYSVVEYFTDHNT